MIVKKRRYSLLLTLVVSSGISLLIVWPQLNSSGSYFIFEPGWFLKTMMEAPDRLRTPEWELLRQMYIEKGNIPRLIQLWGKAFGYFLLGNLGVRIVGLLGLRTGNKDGWVLSSVLRLLSLGGLLMCLLFLQRGTVWNTIQFFYYTIFVFNIYAALVMGNLISRLPNKMIANVVVVIFIILSIPSSIQTFFHYYQMSSGNDYFLVSNNELKILNYIKNNRRQGLVLTQYHDSAYVSTLSSMPVYFEDQAQAGILNLDIKEKKQMIDAIFCKNNTDQLKQLIDKENVDYLLVKTNKETTCTINPTNTLVNIREVIKNDSGILYEIL